VRVTDALASLFFIAFITVCAFSLVNLYVGVLFFQFSRIRAQAETGSCSTENEELQQQWLELAKLAFRTRPREIPPAQKMWLRQVARTLAMSKRFDAFVMFIVVCNVMMMAMTTYGQGPRQDAVFENINLVCVRISMCWWTCCTVSQVHVNSVP
jgi:hypothetical protein